MWQKEISESRVELKRERDEMPFYVRSGNNEITETMGQEISFPSIRIVINFTFMNVFSFTACRTKLFFSVYQYNGRLHLSHNNDKQTLNSAFKHLYLFRGHNKS
jgi:hypothetical protein